MSRPNPPLQVGGIVTCGGRSSRMGRPKAWLPFGDELLLPRVVRLLASVVDPIVVVAAPDQPLPPLPDAVAIARDPVEGRGPLQGLAVGLQALEGRCDAAFFSSCDAPFLRSEFVRFMIERLGDHSISVPWADGFHHPLAAVYRLDVLPRVEALLAADRLRPTLLFGSEPTAIVDAETLRPIDPTLASLRNVNTPDEYAAALRDAGLGS